MVSDIHHILPTDGKVNGMRSNYPYGKVTIQHGLQNGSNWGLIFFWLLRNCVEPINEFKGDVARGLLYFVTRYQTKLSGFSSGNMLNQVM
jgi:endonuclease I